VLLIILSRLFVRALSRVTSSGAARLVLWATLRTRRPRGRPHFAGRCRRLALPGSPAANVVLHELPSAGPETGPRVLLVHGWNGRASDWSPIAATLVARGCRVIAVDMPAHGAASSRSSSLPRFVRALEAIDRELGPLDVWVGHSMGAAAVVAAVARGAHARRLVLVNGMVTPAHVMIDLAHQAGLSPAATQAFLARVERQEGMSLVELDVARNAARVDADALIVHDENDRMIPFAEAQRLARAWTRARFMRTIGLGHRRILEDGRIASAIAAFALQ
jgi:pimeloyl-ACP methyl ester carboxylesterase